MSGVVISYLPSASTLTGAEIVPVVQDGTTVKTTVNAWSYTPAGTGAVTTTIQSKLRESVSVFDFMTAAQVSDVLAGTAAIDVSGAVQNAISSLKTLGGNLIFPAGKYLFSTQVTIDRTYAASGSNFVGERNLIISGYGAEIRTTGSISAFDVKGGWSPNYNCLIQGFTIYHRGNTQAVAGIRMIGAGLVTCKEISVVVSSSLPAGYAAFKLQNTDPADPDTGCFWCLIEQCAIRPWSGSDGYVTYGVKAIGAANALTLRNNNFSGSDTHVYLSNETGQTYTPNAVNIDGNFFEGPSTAVGIMLDAPGPTYHITGCRITNNRFESLNTAIYFYGAGTTVQVPTYMSGNYADTGVTTYISNSLNIPVIMLDFALVGAPMGQADIHSKDGIIIQNDNSSYDALTVKASTLGKGFVLQRQSDGAVLGNIKYASAAGSIGMQLAGSYSTNYRPLTIVGCQGIAARDTSANNLAGTSNFSASTQKVVSLPVAETDANYLIFLEARANQKLWVSARTTTTFTVDSDTSTSNTFGWLLIRHL